MIKTIDLSQYTVSANLPIGMYHLDIQPNCPLHQHAYLEIVVVQNGSGMHETDGHCNLIMAGDVLAIHPSQVHRFWGMHKLSLTNVMLIPEQLPLPWEYISQLPGYRQLLTLPANHDTTNEYGRLHLCDDAFQNITTILRAIEEMKLTTTPGQDAILLSQVFNLLVALTQYVPEPTAEQRLTATEVFAVARWIEQHYMEKVTLQQLADMAQVSERTLLTRFRDMTRYSPIEYLIHHRMHKAAGLLHQPDLAISAIALQVGMPDSNYFTRQFKQVMGMSPRTYRALIKDSATISE